MKLKKVLSVLLVAVMLLSVMPFTAFAAPPSSGDSGIGAGGTITIAKDELSETISLAYAPLSAISGTHYSVSADNLVGESAVTINDMHPMTINARKGETITKVVLTYSWVEDKNTVFASAGTFDGDATFSGINAQQVTISSRDNVNISAVRVYFEGDLNNPTVTLTGGANAKSSGGLLTQSYLPGAMDTVTYTALADATFPEFETYTLNGVTVERTSEKVVTVSGTPTANTAITVPDAESSSKIVTWNSSLINDYISKKISEESSYSDTENGITLTESEGEISYFGNGYLETNDDTTLVFSTTTGKFTSIEIEANDIYSECNWTTDENILKWNGTPSESVSLTGGLFIMGISSITFVIEPAAPTPSAYAGYVPAEADDADALAAKVVKFNGHDWYMIEDNSTSATEGTVTLFAKDPIFASYFHDSSNVYSSSTVKGELDKLTAEGGSFAGVSGAIESVKVKGTDSDSEVDAKLWLLSSGEANNIPVNVRMCSQASEAIVNAWWLRSADSDGTIAEFVMGSNGHVANGGSGANVNQSLGVRPALQLDLSKVEFDSETKTFAPAPAVNYVAEVSGTGYATLEEAIAAASAGNTVKLVDDIDFTETYAKRASHYLDISGLTIDLNGHTITTYTNGVLWFGNDATIKNGSFVGLSDDQNRDYAITIYGKEAGYLEQTQTVASSNITLENLDVTGGISAWKAQNVVIKNCDVAANNYYAVWADVDNTTVVIESGSFTSNCVKTNGVIGAAKQDTNSTIAVKGGDFTIPAKKNIVLKSTTGDQVNISGGTFNVVVPVKYCADGFVPVTEKNAQGKYEVTEAQNGYSLTIAEKIDVNFTISTDSYGAEGGTIVVNGVDAENESAVKSEKTFDINSLSRVTGGAYDGNVIVSLEVAPAQLAEVFTLSIYDASGTFKGKVESSVYNYANAMKADATYGELMTALINYGALAKDYFNYDGAEITPAEGYNTDLTAAENNELISRREAGLTTGNASFDGMVYFAKVEPEFKFYFAGTNVGTAQLSENDLSVVLTKTDNGVAAKVTGFKASDFGKTFTVTVDGTALTINGYAYIASALKSESLKSLATGLFRYAQAAEALA